MLLCFEVILHLHSINITGDYIVEFADKNQLIVNQSLYNDTEIIDKALVDNLQQQVVPQALQEMQGNHCKF